MCPVCLEFAQRHMLIKHEIDFLKRFPRAFRHEDPGKHEGTKSYRAIDKADFGAEICVRRIQKIRNCEANYKAVEVLLDAQSRTRGGI
jgi:hypothetical protein